MSKRQEKKKLELGSPEKLRIGIARACFNTDITQQQLDAATTVLESYNISYDVIEVAGCFEITHALQKMALTKKYNGLVALGCLIKGETIHYDVVVKQSVLLLWI